MLRVYANECDKVIAESEEDANALLCDHTGYSLSELVENEMAVDPEPHDDGDAISITDDDGVKTTMTAAEWAAKEGRCFLCSSEF